MTQQPPVQEPDDSMERFRTFVVYGTAAVLVLGGAIGLFALVILGIIDANAGLGTIGPLIGGAAIFLFGAVQAKATERAIERANIVARSTIGNEGGSQQ